MARARLTQHVVEALIPTDTFSPTTPTGAGISQSIVEVLGSFPGKARIALQLVEVLMTEDESQSEAGGCPECPPGGAGTHIYGWG